MHFHFFFEQENEVVSLGRTPMVDAFKKALSKMKKKEK